MGGSAPGNLDYHFIWKAKHCLSFIQITVLLTQKMEVVLLVIYNAPLSKIRFHCERKVQYLPAINKYKFVMQEQLHGKVSQIVLQSDNFRFLVFGMLEIKYSTVQYN